MSTVMEEEIKRWTANCALRSTHEKAAKNGL